METIIQAVFNNENDALKVRKALLNLDADYDIPVEETYIVHKDRNGAITVPAANDDSRAGIIEGTLAGGLIGLLAGPAGLFVGATSGLLLAAAGDTAAAEDRDGTLTYYGQLLAPGAHVWENNESRINAVLMPYSNRISRADVGAELARAEME